MKKTLTTSEAVNELMSDEYAGWSYRGARALIEYLEELEEDCGMEIEMDVVALRCEYSEYEDLEDIASQYGIDIDEDDEEKEETIRDYLLDRTTVIEFTGGIIIQDY